MNLLLILKLILKRTIVVGHCEVQNEISICNTAIKQSVVGCFLVSVCKLKIV